LIDLNTIIQYNNLSFEKYKRKTEKNRANGGFAKKEAAGNFPPPQIRNNGARPRGP
jgi:hypothetical protein